MRFGVADQNRNAARRLHAGQSIFHRRNERVSTRLGIANIVQCSDILDRIAVNLPSGRKLPVAAKYLEKTAAVLVDVFGRVLIKAGEIEIALGKRGNAS